MAGPASVNFNIYLLKDSYELGDAITSDGRMSEDSVEIPNNEPGILYINRSNLRLPGWASFLAPLNEEAISRLRVASVSAILVVPAAARYFAICFGHGHSYLDKRFVEPRFGLKTCLNVVDPKTIRTVDKRTFDSLGKLSREQSTRPVTISEFGLEVDKDLLRSIVGKPNDERFGKQIAGKDNLNVRLPITITQVPGFLSRCLKESKKDTYKENFEFVDNIAEVGDPDLREQLDLVLVQVINASKPAKVWLAIPDIVDWESSAGFKYSLSNKDQCREDIRLRDFLARWELDGQVSVDQLQRRRVVQMNSAETDALNSWSVYHCLYAEVDYDGQLFILSEGAWYAVSKGFVKDVIDELDRLPTYGKQMAEWGDEHEPDYNRRIANGSNGHFVLMDQKMIRHGGGSSSIEFCDLYSANSELIHVKHYSGSSVLSHLFHQGTVSAIMTAGDLSFREKVNGYLPDSHQLPMDSSFKTSDYEVVFAIGTREPIGFELPFFSKVSLRNAHRELRVSGYKLSLAIIRRNKLAKIAA